MVGRGNGLEVLSELCDELRNKFINELSESADAYDHDDIERIKNDDDYCKRFLRHKKLDIDQAFIMLKEALAWRKSFDVKNISTETIPEEYFSAKAVFPYNQDKEENSIVMLLVRFHRKGAEYAPDLRRFLVYWIEKMEKESASGKITVIMNCIDAGISHLDLDLIKFLITLFRSYYPDSLAYILIYEMPWIFNTAWKVIKSWLPEETVDKIKFVNRTSILEYVDKECLSLEMGGTDTHEYEPPAFNKEAHSNSEVMANGTLRRVHFSENETQSNESLNGPFSSLNGQQKANESDASHVFVTDDFTFIGGIIKISPARELVFYAPSQSRTTMDVKIRLTCMARRNIAYKVRTNNLESYRVKPSAGILEPGKVTEITVFVVQGYNPRVTDKFLIMATEMPDSSSASSGLNVFWRSRTSDQIVEHKLKCVVDNTEIQDSTVDIENTLQNINSILTSINSKLQNMEMKQISLQSKQNFHFILIFILLGLVISLVMNANFNNLASAISCVVFPVHKLILYKLNYVYLNIIKTLNKFWSFFV